jgi:hypothetical protein
MSKNTLFFILVFFLIVGCAKQPNLYTSDEIMEEFHPAYFEFKYLQAKGRIVLEEPSGKITKGTITLRAKKDSALWFSITPGLGLEAIRGLVTAEMVQIRDRMNGDDVNMSFSEIKALHGLSLTLPLIQNMVYANIPEEFSYRDRLIRIGKYFELTQVREGVRYHSRVSTNIAKVSELRTNSLDDRGNLEFSYPVFEDVDGQPFPNKMLMKLAIKNKDGEQNTIIHIDFSKIETSSTPISFPFQY